MEKVIIHRNITLIFLPIIMVQEVIHLALDHDDLFDYLPTAVIIIFGLSALSLLFQGKVWDIVKNKDGKDIEIIERRLDIEIAIKKTKLLISENHFDTYQIRSFSFWRFCLGMLIIVFMFLISWPDWRKLFM